jgi:hypothetical protein
VTDPAAPEFGTAARADRPPVPKSVRLAVAGIFLLAVLSLEGVWVAFDPGYRSFLGTQLDQSSSGALTSPEIDTARSVALVVVGVGSLVVAALLCWLAFKVRAGRRWARLMVSVVVTIGLLYTLRDVFAADHHPGPVSQAIELVELLVRIGLVALLWAPEDARAFFNHGRDERVP